MRIEKEGRVCYIIDRKGDTNVQVIAKPEENNFFGKPGKVLFTGKKGMIPVYR